LSGQRRGRGGRSRRAGAAPAGTPDRPRYAAIDLGTNNCRLLVAEPSEDGLHVVDAFSRIVRLGEGLARDGRLSEAAMGRAVAALRVCADKLRRHDIVGLRAVATEACRRAANGDAFRSRVRRETGLSLEVIAQEEEARLALSGCAALLQPEVPNALVFDIGGGSTEIIWLRARDGGAAAPVPPPPAKLGVTAWYSLPVGVVGLAERHGGADAPSDRYPDMIDDVLHLLHQAMPSGSAGPELPAGRMQMIGTSGTVTTLAGVYQNLARYDRSRVDGCYLSFDTIRAISRRIAAMSYRERLMHPCIGRHRADLVVAGCAILEALCQTWPVGNLRVADRGLREGMLLQMMGRVGADGLAVDVAGDADGVRSA
jgi:exopolyphosphatase/guanosine-5'-triphosphate,3'-diphosphate pyrophosphatase